MIRCQAGHPLDECHPRPLNWVVISEDNRYEDVGRVRRCPHCGCEIVTTEILSEDLRGLLQIREAVSAFAELLR